MSRKTYTHCPQCNRRVVQCGSDGKAKIRTRIIVFSKSGECEIVCRCGSDVAVDITMGEDLVKGMVVMPRLVIKG